MVNKLTKSALDKLIFEINSLIEVQKFKRLNSIVSKDEVLKKRVDKLHEISKQMTHAKEFNLPNAYKVYQEQYNALISEFEDNIIFQMYLESSEEVKEILFLVTKEIEKIIADKINE